MKFTIKFKKKERKIYSDCVFFPFLSSERSFRSFFSWKSYIINRHDYDSYLTQQNIKRKMRSFRDHKSVQNLFNSFGLFSLGHFIWAHLRFTQRV